MEAKRVSDAPVAAPNSSIEPNLTDRFDAIAGRVLGGQYLVQEYLGSGGFGDVFRAVQERTGQSVALKLFRPRTDAGAPDMERQVARFHREMRICAELHHPHIVRIIDSGRTEGGLLFSVFEHVPGKTLAELLEEQGALTLQTAIDVMVQVLDALVCAHAKGVVHRDLKPSNIMISTTGARPHAIVLDFGISALMQSGTPTTAAALTLTNEALGTPSYAAPEQLRGEQPSPKSDLYAWGLLCLESMTGRRVFQGASAAEITYRQLSAEPVPIPESLASHWLGVLLRWVLQKDATRRAGQAEAVLERFAEKRPLGAIEDAHGFLIAEPGARSAERSRHDESPTQSVVRVQSRLAPSGERRLLTVLCCALRSATAQTPEAMEENEQSLRDLQRLCSEIATRLSGHEVGVMGGELLLYFGYPETFGSDARRAAIAALEIANETRTGAQGLEVRLGLHTGLVLCGAERNASSRLSTGITPAEAMHLASRAPAGAILISAETYRELGSAFESQKLLLEGAEHAYRLTGESRAESALDAGALDAAPFVGRSREFGALEEARRSARERGRAVLLVGEPGLGKSRLVKELRSASSEAAGWLEARCFPEAAYSALQPVINLVREELGLAGCAPELRATHLAAGLTELGIALDPAMPLLCPWLGVTVPDSYQPLPYAPLKLKDLFLDVMVELVLKLAGSRDAVVIVEDLHWADSTTLEWLERLILRIAEARVLLLLTARPEFGNPLTSEHLDVLALASLDRPAVEQMIAALTSGHKLPSQLEQRVVENADGIPMFVQEIIRLLRGRESEAAQDIEVPRTLRGILTSRLDRLGRAKHTAQIAAAIGREFEHAVLVAIAETDEVALLADLEAMISAGLVTRRRTAGDPLYVFCHALIRDVAYDNLMSGDRSRIHLRIAEVLERSFPEFASTRPEVLAEHWARGKNFPKALALGQQGIGAALSKSLFREAGAQTKKALGWVKGLEDIERQNEVELELLGLLTPALMATSGWGSDEVHESIERAEQLSECVPATARVQYSMLWLLLMYHNIRADFDRFSQTQARALSIAVETGDPVLESVVYAIVGQNLLTRGRLTEARAACERALSLYDRDAHQTHRMQFGQDIEVFTLATLGLLLSLQGHVEEAIASADRALKKAVELDSIYNVCLAKAFLAGTFHYCGDRERTQEVTSALYLEAEAHGLVDWLPIARILGGWATTELEEPERETQRLFELGNRYGGPYWNFTLAQIDCAAGRFEDALRRIDHALAQSAELGVFYYEPELHRLKGDCLAAIAARPNAPESFVAAAKDAFEQAIAASQAQGAKLPELRAALGLARIAGPGASEPSPQLTSVAAWFAEKASFPELIDARQFLNRSFDDNPKDRTITGSN